MKQNLRKDLEAAHLASVENIDITKRGGSTLAAAKTKYQATFRLNQNSSFLNRHIDFTTHRSGSTMQESGQFPKLDETPHKVNN